MITTTTRRKAYEILGTQNLDKEVLLKVLKDNGLQNIEAFEMLNLTADQPDHGYNAEYIAKLKRTVSVITSNYFEGLKTKAEWVKKNHAAGEAIQKKQNLTMNKIVRDLESIAKRYTEDIGEATGLVKEEPKANEFLISSMRSLIKYIRVQRVREDGTSWLHPNSKGFI